MSSQIEFVKISKDLLDELLALRQTYRELIESKNQHISYLREVIGIREEQLQHLILYIQHLRLGLADQQFNNQINQIINQFEHKQQ